MIYLVDEAVEDLHHIETFIIEHEIKVNRKSDA